MRTLLVIALAVVIGGFAIYYVTGGKRPDVGEAQPIFGQTPEPQGNEYSRAINPDGMH